jgi:hypothetical protein
MTIVVSHVCLLAELNSHRKIAMSARMGTNEENNQEIRKNKRERSPIN